ncbi:MAG TPA: bifunctional phosphoribosylaminoimidazolecarboxamide formyltransferase/IMP cyclohydrolase [Clostridiaceae bacterium]|jgi:phosphoribosylaminoimidazolecarboxamide formyltransferase/IMP cyclohydrolase|nr:bifunctional phosphoribosylaminoimidazolecarboxamide formyltransferase/IMP cyclohydrolase [Clostridiaceae bacterium]
MIKRALISVSDKKGITEFSRKLVEMGVEILSTGGTSRLLSDAGIPCKEVSDVTGFPECLDGRVKTLHPLLHGGILAIRSNPDHMKRVSDLGIGLIDLIVVNLYPFKQTIMKPGVSFEECVENIDIGGPSMLRAAAKNHNDVTVVTDPEDYEIVLSQIEKQGDTDGKTRFMLAKKVFEHTAAYDALIANYFLSQSDDKTLPNQYTISFEKGSEMRYGENSHQKATFFKSALPVEGSLSKAEQLNGKELSYNNIADADATISCLKEFSKPTVVAVKHANPCGVGSADNVYDAWVKAFEADTVSIFGGIVAVNREVDAKTAEAMSKIFLEVIIAPSYTEDAKNILCSKKNLRVLVLPGVATPIPSTELNYKRVVGGLLVQDYDTAVPSKDDMQVVTQAQPDPKQIEDMIFAMKVVKHVKSNGIVVVKDNQTLGVGPGQTNRVGAAQIALAFAGDKAKGAVMGSDAFFPFADCVEEAQKAGITTIVQPGGSIRDQESIDECNKHGIAMVFTGKRHFKH